MTEGEFKKRIKSIVEAIEESMADEGTISLDSSWFELIVEEAQKEFPPFYLTKLDNGAIIFADSTDVYNWKTQAKEWFLKWFGLKSP